MSQPEIVLIAVIHKTFMSTSYLEYIIIFDIYLQMKWSDYILSIKCSWSTARLDPPRRYEKMHLKYKIEIKSRLYLY